MLSILSLVVGIITVVYSLNLNKKTNNSSTFSASCNCDLIKTEIKNLKTLINQIDKKTNQNVSSSKNNPVNSVIADLTNRIEVIEKGISDNPEKTLSLLNMNNDISQLEKSDESIREINKTEIESLKNEMENQNSWISGLLITIFGLVLSFAVPNLLANIKENKIYYQQITNEEFFNIVNRLIENKESYLKEKEEKAKINKLKKDLKGLSKEEMKKLLIELM